MADAPRGQVVRLPAYACVYFRQGRCLFEERLNPGLQRSWRCQVLARWEAVYDEFLDRAERFVLSEADLAGLWRRRFERLAEESLSCPDFQPLGGEAMPECAHLDEDICLLRLPGCLGQCERYTLHEKT